MDKISKNFYAHEFLPPGMFKMFGNNGLRYIDPQLIDIAEALRERFREPVTINNYYFKGNFSLSGLRPHHTNIGAKFSDHKFGRAIDVKIRDVDPEDVRNEISINYPKWRDLGVTAIELNTPTWTHISTANFNSKNLTKIPVL